MVRQGESEGQMDIKTVGIVGAGQMGNGIAHVFAAGWVRRDLLNDISEPTRLNALSR
jgi:3-hydroxybutyryl-CoA dehydrogenase